MYSKSSLYASHVHPCFWNNSKYYLNRKREIFCEIKEKLIVLYFYFHIYLESWFKLLQIYYCISVNKIKKLLSVINIYIYIFVHT